MIGTIISLPLTEWIIIFSLLIGFIIYSNWSISKYKELVEDKKLIIQRFLLREGKEYIKNEEALFLIHIQQNNIVYGDYLFDYNRIFIPLKL